MGWLFNLLQKVSVLKKRREAKFKVSKTADGIFLHLYGSTINSYELLNYLHQLGITPSQAVLTKILNSRAGAVVRLDQDVYTQEHLYSLNLDNDGNSLNLSVGSDRMNAYLTINTHTEGKVGEQYILNQLQEAGIVFGINPQAINQAVNSPGESVEVARGIYPVDGRDAQIEYLHQQPQIRPVLDEDGRVDYYELGCIVGVQAGDIVARRQPAVPGQPGMNINGEEIPARNGQDKSFAVGSGIIVNRDYALAEFDGALSWSNNKVSVIRMLVIPGDVDFSVGNISFMGKVLVEGSIKDGFRVEADDDIEVRGGISNANVVSRRGSVTVHKGIIGVRSLVCAQKNIAAKFAQEATLESGQNIFINEYVLRCNIKSGDSVLIQGRRGIILGNNSICARAKIKAANIQNSESLDLQVEGINRRLYYEQIKSLNVKIEELENRLGLMSDLIRTYRSTLDDPQTIIKLQQRIPEFIHLSEEFDELVEKRSHLVNILKNTRGEGVIEIGGGIEAGMLFTIKQNPVKLKERLRNISMYYDPDEQRIVIHTDKF